MNLQKFIIFSVLFLDIIGIAIIIPTFPELKAYYGITDFQVTLGLTIYSLCAFLAAPLLGQLSDKFGRKRPLALCIAGTMLSYLILLVTKQYRLFMISRIINGLTGGNTSIIQAILTDISPDKETKSKNFGLMGMFFGLGFIIGPVVGSLLLKRGNVETIFRFGGLFALVELVLIIFHFSNTNHPIVDKTLSYNSFTVMWKYFRKPEFRNFLVSIFFLGVGGFMINVTQSLYMANLFGTTGEQYGYYLAIAGLIGAVNMGFMVPKFRTKNFNTKTLIVLAHIILILGYIAVGATLHLGWFLGIFYATIFFSGFYMPVYNLVIMSHAKPGEIGELSGMMGGLQSMLMFVGPLIGGVMLATSVNVYYGAAVMFVISFAVMLRYLVSKEN